MSEKGRYGSHYDLILALYDSFVSLMEENEVLFYFLLILYTAVQ